MNNPVGVQIAHNCWVGWWKRRRLVVFDPSIQPTNSNFMLLYFVQGRSLCFRDKLSDRTEVISVRNEHERSFALYQYKLWISRNKNAALEKQKIEHASLENPDPLKIECPACQGECSWYYTVGTYSEGANSDGQNISGNCSVCSGSGFVENIYEMP